MPLAFVVALPTVFPSTVKVTVAPETDDPPFVWASVALRLIGPVEPNITEAGVGLDSASVVPAGVRTSVVVPDERLLFWQLCGLAVPVIVNDPPGLMVPLVFMVSVDVFVAPVLVREAGLKEDDAPAGNPEAFKLTVQELLFPLKV